MKKFFNVLLCFTLLFLVVGCGDSKDDPGKKDDPTPSKATYWDADGNGIDDWQEEEVTLKFATWQYTNSEMVTIDVLMAQEFEEKYPNIHIEFVTVGEEYEYNDNMLALMETNELPDVFLIRRLESFLPYNMLADLTEMYDNDPDSKYIFQSLQSSGIFEGKRYAIPTYIYPQFWVVNKDILEEKNIPIPTYDWTWDQMEAIAKAANDETKHIIGLYGRQGYYGEGGTRVYLNELPKVLKIKNDGAVGKNWAGWSYDGEKFNFDDPAFQEAMNKMQTGLQEGWLKTGLTGSAWEAAEGNEGQSSQKTLYYNDPDFVPTTGGKVAVWVEASWSFKDEKDKIEFDYDIYPGPSGVTSGNTDIAGVSSLSKHKQAAYQFLKWMSYSEEGILTRFDIYKESGSELYQQGNNYPYPIVDYGIDENGVNKIWSSIPYGDTAPGLVSAQFLEALRNGAYTLNKEVCGWDNVDYCTADYFKQVYANETTYAAVKASIQEAAEEAMAETKKNILETLKGFK